jgi:hypothetical protein
LVFINITDCCSSRSIGECKILDFVKGDIYDGRQKHRLCSVQPDLMYTLVLAEYRERELILKHFRRLRAGLGSAILPDYYLVIDQGNNKGFPKTVCNYVYPEDRVLVLHCINSYNIFDTLVKKRPSSNRKVWKTDMGIDFSPNHFPNPTDLWKFYFEIDEDQVFITAALQKSNESAQSYNGYTIAYIMKQSDKKTLMFSSVIFDDTTTRFLSCYALPILSLQMYIQPFQVNVWITLFVFGSCITIFIYLYNRRFQLSQSFNPFFFFLSTLVEEPYSVPTALWKNRVFKTITIPWLLTAVIFSNLYAGLMISDVTAPRRSKILTSFDDFLNTEIEYRRLMELPQSDAPLSLRTERTDTQNSINDSIEEHCVGSFDLTTYKHLHSQVTSTESFAILQSPVQSCGEMALTTQIQKRFLSHHVMYSGFSQLEYELYKFRYHNANELYYQRVVSYFSMKTRHYPKEPLFSSPADESIPQYLAAAIEKELVSCGRSVYMGDLHELMYELSYLRVNYPMKFFYLSTSIFEVDGSKPVIWNFRNPGNSKVPYYFRLLRESGIPGFISDIRRHKFFLQRRIGTRFVKESMPNVTSLGISGSIQTIFMTLIALLSMATTVFFFEIVLKLFKQLIK